ncbi:alpha/beta hydrolase [Rhodomicrobium vannielii ATCC 17100]|uniref:alpha/beta hydrolase n=1 Tax=Rhodomicrobium vannielii TaxID=1069 RepID=UPI001919722F|nr:alpha/beta hydrolase [Rhodomicrobium vannielii]MBJ7533325.1 alpha/beta hydrolase [Rhodomicrobium vannielii ATCC 17100]
MNSGKLQLLPVPAADGSTSSIAWRFRKAEENRTTFVWFSGFRSQMDGEKATALDAWSAGNGAGCLRFDYSGHGLSSGACEDGTISRWLAEADAVLEAAAVSGRSVFVGSSMGGWISLLLTRRLAELGRPAPAALVLIAPAWNMTRVMLDRFPPEAKAALERDGVFLRPSAYGAEPYPITKKLVDDGERHLFGEAIGISAPIRIIHGQQDADIPWRHSLDLIDRLAAPDIRLTLVKDAQHRLSRPQDLALLFATLAEFL